VTDLERQPTSAGPLGREPAAARRPYLLVVSGPQFGELLDLEPGAAQALVELERAVAERPEYLSLATQLHLLARR